MKDSILEQLVENAVCTEEEADADPGRQLNRLSAVFECPHVKCQTLLFGWDDIRDHRCSYLPGNRQRFLLPTPSAAYQLKTKPSLLPKFVSETMELFLRIPKWAPHVKRLSVTDMDNTSPHMVCSSGACKGENGLGAPLNWRQFLRDLRSILCRHFI